MCKWSFVAFISSIRPWSGPVWWISWVQAEASHASFQFRLDYIIQIIFLKVFWPASLLRLDKKKKPGWKVVTTLSHHSTSRSSIVLLATCSSFSFSLLPDHEELPKQTAHACFRHAWQAPQALWGPLGTTPLPLVSVLPGFSSPLGENTLCFITFAIWYSSVCSAAITRAHSCKRQVCELSRGSHSAEKWWCVCVFPCVCCVLNMFVWSQ